MTKKFIPRPKKNMKRAHGTIAKRFRDSMHKSFNDKIFTIGTSFISDHI
jgi:hypothetical protein